MAVVDVYANEDVAAGLRPLTYFTGIGETPIVARQGFSVAAADSNGSTYRVFNGVPTHYRIHEINIFNGAITGGTDFDLGFYAVDNGAVIDADILVNGADLSSAHAVGSPLVGTSNLALLDHTKPIWELLGYTKFSKPSAVDLVLTANVVGSADGDIMVDATFIPVNG